MNPDTKGTDDEINANALYLQCICNALSPSQTRAGVVGKSLKSLSQGLKASNALKPINV